MKIDLTWPDRLRPGARLLAWLGMGVVTGVIITGFAYLADSGKSWGWRFLVLWVVLATASGYAGSAYRRRHQPTPPVTSHTQ